MHLVLFVLEFEKDECRVEVERELVGVIVNSEGELDEKIRADPEEISVEIWLVLEELSELDMERKVVELTLGKLVEETEFCPVLVVCDIIWLELETGELVVEREFNSCPVTVETKLKSWE